MTLGPVAWPTLGWQVIDWIETFLVYGSGDVEGDEIGQLDDEFALFVCWCYRVHPADHGDAGRRLIHRAVLSRPKGRAKSMLAGMLSCVEALGPVRFSHWAEAGEVSGWGYEFQEGEPVGRPVRSPFIRCLATEEDQAGNTYDNVFVMLTKGLAAREYGLRANQDVGLTRTILPTGGEIRPSTSGDASKDGGLESFAVADETHLYVLEGLRKMYRTVARNTGKRKEAEPWMLDTTTAWQPGERSVAERTADMYAHLPVEECVRRHGVLYDHRQGDEPKRFGDDRSLAKAMRAGYGPASEWMDFKRIVRIVRDAEDPEQEAYRYFLNIARKSAETWMTPAEILAVIDPFEVELGQMVTLGFDGSENNDHTVLMGCTEPGDLFCVGAWTPRLEDGTGWREDVDRCVGFMHEHYQVVGMYGDPAYWVSELGAWAAEHGTVAEFWTGGHAEAKMAFATGTCRTALRHGARLNPVPLLTAEIKRAGKTLVQWHFENARTRKVRVRRDPDSQTEDQYLVRKERPGSPLKIDGVTSSILARRRRDDALKLGEFEVRPQFARAAWQ